MEVNMTDGSERSKAISLFSFTVCNIVGCPGECANITKNLLKKSGDIPLENGFYLKDSINLLNNEFIKYDWNLFDYNAKINTIQLIVNQLRINKNIASEMSAGVLAWALSCKIGSDKRRHNK